MNLAFNLLLTLLIELPIVAFFFRRRKRNNALVTGLLVNIITWPIINVIRLNTEINLNYIEIGVVLVEGIAYYIMLECGWRKAAIISLLSNGLSFLITNLITIDLDAYFRKTAPIVQ